VSQQHAQISGVVVRRRRLLGRQLRHGNGRGYCVLGELGL
jgi:hypothetical protein